MMVSLFEKPGIQGIAPDVQKLLRFARWLPPLETLPVPFARALYAAAAVFCNPPLKNWARHSKRSSLLHVFEPVAKAREDRIYVFIHGGGWTLGSPFTHRSYCAWLAWRTESMVFAIDYRRAPEHPYPAALEDCMDAYTALCLEHPNSAIHVVGDSAGGQLSLSLCHRLHEQGARVPSSLLLHYPVIAEPGTTSSYASFGKGLFLSKSMMQWFWKLYRPAADRTDVFALQWRDWAWLPPVTLCLARHDVLFDEGFALAQVLAKAKVLQNLHVEENLPHAYVNFMKCPSIMSALEAQVRHYIDNESKLLVQGGT